MFARYVHNYRSRGQDVREADNLVEANGFSDSIS